MRSLISLGKLLCLSCSIVLACYYLFYHQVLVRLDTLVPCVRIPSTTIHTESFLNNVDQLADYFESYPLDSSEFGQLGKRIQIVRDWISESERQPSLALRLAPAIERTAQALLPYLLKPSNLTSAPFLDLRYNYNEKSVGIIIVTGRRTFRYACHLIQNIRVALESKIPIEIAYAGEDDLPVEYRDYITSISNNVTTLDILPRFQADSIDISSPDSGWAIKPYAILASRFSSVILLDADAVLLQSPEVLLSSAPFLATGTYLFHDRLLWPHVFTDRHEWWKSHLSRTNKPLSPSSWRSKVINGPYAEEGDSGLVLVDKSRLEVFMGLVHIAWQNTKPVREAYTYVMGYGDKESWWFGFELTGVEYAMEEHYAAIIGMAEPVSTNEGEAEEEDEEASDITPPSSPDDGTTNDDTQQHFRRQICSFQIAHVSPSSSSITTTATATNTNTSSSSLKTTNPSDRRSPLPRLLWLNGSLLKNKVSNLSELLNPEENIHWMVDGQWIKKARKIPSCMIEGVWKDVDLEDEGQSEDEAPTQQGGRRGGGGGDDAEEERRRRRRRRGPQPNGIIHTIDPDTMNILRISIEEARKVDLDLRASDFYDNGEER